jgi:hypothetical protein
MASNNNSDQDTKWSTEVPNTSRSDRGNIRRSWDPFQHPELGVQGKISYFRLKTRCKIQPGFLTS